MAWFLALQGPPSKVGQGLTYELHDSADVAQITEEMLSSASSDRPVAIPAVLGNRPRPVTVYVRPAVWGAWSFYEMTEEERREMLAANPLINAVAQAAKQKQAKAQQGPSVVTLPRLDSNQQPFG
ncbi:hypothetical protein E2F47_20055 [Mycobacterium eburneum]|nr:hypothetical protein [Mycobacterium talmoniae]TDH49637.1 hypothetical protein E2F47_20055 [Mycobacterium eburneum]